jgi:hypothetical protein
MKLVGFLAFVLMLTGTMAPRPALSEGAIAAARDGQVGLSYNYSGRHRADERAFEECGRGCRIVATFRRTCAAVATGERGSFGWSTQNNLRRAEENALESCAREGGRRCRIAARRCDERG